MEIRLGKGAGKEIEEAIRRAGRRVIVISPWIGKEEARLLDTISSRAEVTVVTLPEGNPALDVLSEGYLHIPTLLLALALLFSGAYLAILYLPLLLLSLLSVPLFFLARRKRLKRWVRTAKNLHAKVYVVDDVLYLSSANFTPSGLRRNVEFVVIVRDEKVVEEVVRRINTLF